ncbi:MAG TPA: hypothetical protein VM755_14935 [Stellaceae bacterium]|nr:hypothetical protein [Stellaceae bacterium]
MFDKLGFAVRALAISAILLAGAPFAGAQTLGSPSTLIGRPPPLPLTLPQRLRAQANPFSLLQLQSRLPPVGSPPPAAPPPSGSPWQFGTQPPGAPPLSNPLLLTDGTVIVHVSCTGTWWRLTPDQTGSYRNGSWSGIAAMPTGYEPRFFSSAVLPSGKVRIEGGEYNAKGLNCNEVALKNARGAIWDPRTDSWASVAPPAGWNTIGDAPATVLANRIYMQADCCDSGRLAAVRKSRAWQATGSGKFDSYDEEGWTLLPSGGLLTVDAYVGRRGCGRNTEAYGPAAHAWSSAGDTPAQLADCANPSGTPSYEMGPQILRPDGTVVAFGGTTCNDPVGGGVNPSCDDGAVTVVTYSAIFDTASFSWSAGPDIPAVGGQNYTLADAPAALEPNGDILFAASPNAETFSNPTHFFELSGADNTIAQTADPSDAGAFTSFQWNLLVLPTGQIMALETDGSTVWYYTPTSGPNPAWTPSIAARHPTGLAIGGTYKLKGTQLNGLSQGAAYGDDQQAATNYPLVRITNEGTGHVFYARSFGFATASIKPGIASSLSFVVPAMETGAAQLAAVANGIASPPAAVTVSASPR